MMGNKVYVIGIGYTPLNKKASEVIFNSSIILSSGRLYEVFKRYDEFEIVKDRIMVINNVDETVEFIKSQTSNQDSKITLLASGDPMFFGIGRRLVSELGKDAVEIIPDLSCIQLGFSRIKDSWDDALLISLHGGPNPEKRRKPPYEINELSYLIQRHEKIAILTDAVNNPTKIARVLLDSTHMSHPHNSQLKMYVCERLGYHDERITEGWPKEIASKTFSEPNLVIIKNKRQEANDNDIHFGLKEDEISHIGGLITKDEVRAVAIHKLRLPQKGVFWDIGAGSGSVSIESARLCPHLKIFAIERDERQISHITENKKRFSTPNVEIIRGEAPDALNGLPRPHRVFIGGSGERLKEILDYVVKNQVELIVINASTIETMTDAIQCFENNRYDIDISQLTISRTKTLGGKRHMSALNPIFIVVGKRC